MGNTIDSSLFLENKKQPQRSTPNNNLGKDEFLKILMVQLQNQDPLNPMDDKEFIAQMAQFSSLEQMTKMSTSLEKFIDFQKSNTLSSYVGRIGKKVDWETVTENKDKDGNELEPTVETGTGIINSVNISDNGTVEILFDNGKIIYQDEIKGVQDSGNTQYENQFTLASQMVGKMISWLDENDEQTDSSIITSVHMKNGRVLYELNDGSLIKGEQIIKVANRNFDTNGVEPIEENSTN